MGIADVCRLRHSAQAQAGPGGTGQALAACVRNTCRTPSAAKDALTTITMTTKQPRALELIGL